MRFRFAPLIYVILLLSTHSEALRGDYMTESWNYTTKEVISALSVGDIDGDGMMEAAVASSSEGAVRVFDGDGTLLWDFLVPTYIFDVAVHDFDGDGIAEVVVGGGSHVYFLNSSGDRVWKFYIGNNNVRVVKPTKNNDILVASYSEKCVDNYVVLLDSNGERKWSYDVGRRMPYAIDVLDVEGDGNEEVLVGFIQRGSDTVRRTCVPKYDKAGNILLLDHFGDRIWEVKTGSGVFTLKTGDVDGDSAPEIIVGTQPHLILLDVDNSSLWNTTGVSRIESLDIGDINGDGKPEILYGADNLYNLDRKGEQRWMASTQDRVYTIKAVDLNDDGIQDVVAGSDSLYVFSDLGNRLFKSKNLRTVGDLGVGDFNGDDMPDVIVGAVKQVILYETGYAAKIQKAAAFEQMAKDYFSGGDNESALEYASKAREVYLDIGDLDGTSRMIRIIDAVEGRVYAESTTTTTRIHGSAKLTPEPAGAKDVIATLKASLKKLELGKILGFLDDHAKTLVFIVLGIALLFFMLVFIYVVVRFFRFIHHRMNTPTLDDELKNEGRGIKRGLVRGVEKGRGTKIG